MKKEAEISIIIPVYNGERTIRATLKSILEQDYKNFEVLLIDDGSQDGSKAICQSYVASDRRFRYFFQENGGVSAARNLGLENAVGRFVVFVDADDLLPPQGLALLVDAENKEKDGFICGSHVMNKTRNRRVLAVQPFRVHTKQRPEVLLAALEKVPTAPWAKLYDKEIIDRYQVRFPCDMPYGEDSVFLYRYMEHVEKLVTIDAIVYEYNFLYSNSAGRKFYKDFCLFMKQQLEEKQNLYRKFGISGNSEELCYFRRSIEHYIINERDQEECRKDIGRCIACFPHCLTDRDYGSYASIKDFSGLIRKWIRNNRKYYWTERLKIYMAGIKLRSWKNGSTL